MDPLSNMLSQIKNASMAGKKTAVLPYSKLRFAVANVLLREGFLTAVNRKGRKEKKLLELCIAYTDDTPKLHNVKRLSKPSRRVYIGTRDMRSVRQGTGRLVVSTPKGIMTGEEARKNKVGGEALFEIY